MPFTCWVVVSNMGRKAIDEKGNRYERLTVIRRVGSDKHKRATWLCKCDCGNEVTVVSGNLHSGNTKSCGCLHRELVSLPLGVAAFNQLVLLMKSHARDRGYVWQLTDEQVVHLTKQSCHYCGAEPAQVKTLPRGNGDYIYNGLDRVDNAEGYTIDNVVPCCGKCNVMKRAMTVEEFKTQVSSIYKHFLTKGG